LSDPALSAAAETEAHPPEQARVPLQREPERVLVPQERVQAPQQRVREAQEPVRASLRESSSLEVAAATVSELPLLPPGRVPGTQAQYLQPESHRKGPGWLAALPVAYRTRPGRSLKP